MRTAARVRRIAWQRSRALTAGGKRHTATLWRMTPVEALERAMYLLDRGAAPTSKVRAFQRAIDTITELADGELESLASDGRLETLPNIGPATGGVIADALAGRPSPYLAKLERETEVSPGDGADLLAALRGDCHSHTTWSDGGASLREMATTTSSRSSRSGSWSRLPSSRMSTSMPVRMRNGASSSLRAAISSS